MCVNTIGRCLALSISAAVLSGCAAPKAGVVGDAGQDASALRPTSAAVPGAAVGEADIVEPESHPRARSDAVPTAAEIFDFHPPGFRPGSWREPFIVSYTEGPLNAYRLRTLAELRSLRDHGSTTPPAVAAR